MKTSCLLILLVACTSQGPLTFKSEMHGGDVPPAWTDRVTEAARRWSVGLEPRCGAGMVTVSSDGELAARLIPTAVFVAYGDSLAGGPQTIGVTYDGEGFGISGEVASLAVPKWALESIGHEIGHNLGLDHSTDRASIMWPEDLNRDMGPNADDLNLAADNLGCGTVTQ